ncbi:polyprenyl synthetase family protein [Longispora albida]|uniref:polyprenyl synthetase family protein n=1 Tax=Longispora albida TaxID=203523 RepID=UPI000365319D|nr:polyprenyl synthetase family protein [Longispora albida]
MSSLSPHVQPEIPAAQQLPGLRSRIGGALAAFLDARAGHWPEPAAKQGGSQLVWEALRGFVLAPGKRLRPALCYWGWRAAGGADCQPIIQVAASLELFHAFCLIHDDVMDRAATRRGRPALHRYLADLHARSAWRGDAARFGANTAIDCGDLLLAWSDEMYRTSGLPATALAAADAQLARMRTETIAGQFLDLHEQARGGSLAGALNVIRHKTSPPTVEGPLRIGAAAAGAGPQLLEALTAVGRPLGEAFQLRDDLLGVFGDPEVTGRHAADELREGRPTVLIALTRERADARQARQIAALHGRANLTALGAAQLRRIMLATGAPAAVEDMIAVRVLAARAALAAAPVAPEAREVLAALIDAATRRDL